ncbi:MAG: response regulator [Planctomycetaceae bacterium]|nr:response regulator [Planctomycetaceae bacterium]
MSSETKPAVLLVDDEEDVLFSLKGLLRHEFELHTATSGDQALEILRQHRIHVIMTDQRMPGMTGTQLLSRVRAEFPTAIRIVFTGYADIKSVIEAINNGGLYRYITKPWDPDELVDVLHRAAQRFQEDAQRTRLADSLKTYVQDVGKTVNDLPNGADLISRGESLLQDAMRLLES